jgi:thiamine-phosphate pyrophosphorylase
VTLCLITDRRRVAVVEQCRAAVSAGIDLIQVRERDLDAAALAELVGDLVRLARGTATRVVVNDRLDVALTCGAHGVHLRGDSIAAAKARAIAPAGFLIGRSVHRVDEAVGAAPDVDYLIAGTMFPTSSKPGLDKLLGSAGLAAIARAVSVPVLAVGGVTMDRIGTLADTGAAGVAAIGLFAEHGARLAEVVREARRRFDSVRSAS